MPRVIVTKELADTLRELRLQKKIQAKQLATHINKSPAYVSKLESGKIQTIADDELFEILEYISDSDNMNSIMESILATLELKYSKKDIEEQVWFTNFDKITRQIPIPSELIDGINNRMLAKRIDRSYLLSRINANEGITADERYNKSIPENTWFNSKETGRLCIKINLPAIVLEDLLEKRLRSSNYTSLMCVVYYLTKIEKYGEKVDISDDEDLKICIETEDYLNSFKFYSLLQKGYLLEQQKNEEDRNSLLNSFDRENLETVNKILSGFQFASECNILMANEQLKNFLRNMQFDIGFMMRIISLNFEALSSSNISSRKAFIKEIEELIKKYSIDTPKENQIELYE